MKIGMYTGVIFTDNAKNINECCDYIPNDQYEYLLNYDVFELERIKNMARIRCMRCPGDPNCAKGLAEREV